MRQLNRVRDGFRRHWTKDRRRSESGRRRHSRSGFNSHAGRRFGLDLWRSHRLSERPGHLFDKRAIARGEVSGYLLHFLSRWRRGGIGVEG
ncbi:hypothetical protein BST12_02865 [Mycobacterium angelicum]|uniref:Uncharacterized protein n=1 Tax=Mycobacterium angelicum TaxID=470074 RepID=A0A1X0A5B2_MYCAN|nr:hypothetical protein BST12_02865 [Mycobacterium angelicum]